GKIAHALFGGKRRGGIRKHAGPFAQAGICAEDKRSVLDDRSANGAAELVAVQGVLAQVRLSGQPAIGVELIIAEKLEKGPVHAIRSRLAYHGDRGATEAALVRGIAVRNDAELLYGIRVRGRVARVP